MLASVFLVLIKICIDYGGFMNMWNLAQEGGRIQFDKYVSLLIHISMYLDFLKVLSSQKLLFILLSCYIEYCILLKIKIRRKTFSRLCTLSAKF